MFLMIICAVLAVEIKDLFSSVIAVGAVGLCLCVIFLILKAPDLAITQLVVEVLCLMILIRATIRRDLPFSTSGRWLFNTFITIIFVSMFLSLGSFCLKELPSFGYPIMKVSKFYLDQGAKISGAANLVSSIMLDFRVYDTFGEATILFTAVLSVMTVMRRKARKDVNEPESKDGE